VITIQDCRMKVIYRSIKQEELPALLELHKHLFDEDLPAPDETTINQIWADMLADTKMHVLAAEVDAKIVASCILTIIPNLTRGGQSYGIIENVVTHSAYRKKGIGTGLLKYAQQIAWNNGCYKVSLMTGRQRDEIFRFYEHAGFVRGTKTAFIVNKGEKLS
jgi:GNAT superfamily N-acetyltransferase